MKHGLNPVKLLLKQKTLYDCPLTPKGLHQYTNAVRFFK